MTDKTATPDRASAASLSRTALIIFCTALGFGLVGDVLLRETPWGINLALWVPALSAGLLAVARWNNLPLTGGGRWLIGPAVLFAALLALRDSIMLSSANLLATSICLALIAYRAVRGRIRVATLADYAHGLLFAGVYAAFGALQLVFDDIKWNKIPIGKPARHATSVLTGVAIAAPLLFVFGGLLTAADAVFQKMLSDLFNWDVYEIASHLFWIAFWAWVVAGLLRLTFLHQEHSVQPSSYQGTLGRVEIAIVLGGLIALFAGFVVVQARYLFGGAEALRSIVKLSYAEYARRGFFELVTVAALVLPVLLIMHWLMKKQDPRALRLFRLLSGAVIALLFAIMFSALYRMRLYQIEFGLTELRLYTTAFMGWLAIVFAWFGATVLRGQYDRFAFGALASALAVLLALNVLNPDDAIVRVNAGRAEAANPFDVSYVVGLSADAVPALIEVLPAMTETDRCTAAARILDRWAMPQHFSALTWNLDRVLAWQAVSTHWSYLQGPACPGPGRSD